MDQSFDDLLDVRDLQKWNCIIEPTSNGYKSYGGLYLGDIDCAQDPYLLQQLNIGAMLSVIDEPQIVLPEFMNYLVRETIAIPDCASESLIFYFPRCTAFIESHRTHTNVMVHCFAGISRSASVVLAYLMEKFDWTYERTLNTVKAVRKQVKPNPGFAQQLYQYEQHLKNKKQPKEQAKRPLSSQPFGKAQTTTKDTQRHTLQEKNLNPERLSHQDRRFNRTNSSANKTFTQNEISGLFKTEEPDVSMISHQPKKREYQAIAPSKPVYANNQNPLLQTAPTRQSNMLGYSTEAKNKINEPISMIDLSQLEIEIAKRQKSLAELQKKYLELQTINNEIVQNMGGAYRTPETSYQNSAQKPPQQQNKLTERRTYQQPLHQYNQTQPVKVTQNSVPKTQQPQHQQQAKQIYHFPYNLRH